MNSENSKTSDVHRLRFKLTSKMDLRRGGKGIALSKFSVYYTWKNIKMSYKNNKSKISGEIWDEEFELPGGYYSVSDIQDHLEHIIKKHETLTDKPPVQIFANKIQNRATMKIKSWYYLELLTTEAIKLLGSTEEKITTGKNVETVP